MVFRLFGIFDKLPIFVFLMKENKEKTGPLLSSLHALLFFFSAIKGFDIDQSIWVTIYLISCDMYILVLLMKEKNKFRSLHNIAESINFNIRCVYISYLYDLSFCILEETTPIHAPSLVAIGYFGFETRIEIIWHRAKPNIGRASFARNITTNNILTIHNDYEQSSIFKSST